MQKKLENYVNQGFSSFLLATTVKEESINKILKKSRMLSI